MDFLAHTRNAYPAFPYFLFRGRFLLLLVGLLFVPSVKLRAEGRIVSCWEGQTIQLKVSCHGTAPFYYQWYKNNIEISGAVSDSVSLEKLSVGDSFIIKVRVLNSRAMVYSEEILVEAIPKPNAAPSFSGLSNMSIRSVVRPKGQPLVVGFAPNGSNPCYALIRAVGATLAQFPFNLSGVLQNPRMTLYRGLNALYYNDDWGALSQGDLISTIATRLGAFPLISFTCLDSAFVAKITEPVTVVVGSADGASCGIVLVEAYDSGLCSNASLSNISAFSYVGTGAEAIILGFTVSGTESTSLIIRGVGPSLSAFGVDGIMRDPRLDLYRAEGGNNFLLLSNDDWGGSAELVSKFQSVGAFGLVDNSKDAVIQAKLPAGCYTVILSGSDNSTGVALVELYDFGRH